MPNAQLFGSLKSKAKKAVDTKNEAGGVAYAFSPRHALAQLAATGCLNATFYADAETQLKTVLKLCAQVEPEYIARTAVHAREAGVMKDMPALLCAVLSAKSPALLEKVFHRVVDNGKMLRVFVQVMRSGATGRKSLGSRPKKLVQQWFERRDAREIFFAGAGANPSFGDILSLAHPKPADDARAAFYRWLCGRDLADPAALPDCVRDYEAWKTGRLDRIARSLQNAPEVSDGDGGGLPDAPFLLLMNFPLSGREWREMVDKMPWNALRMNVATLARHGALDDPSTARRLAERLSDPEAVRRARVFPYQIMQSLKAAASIRRTDKQAEGGQASVWQRLKNAVTGGEKAKPKKTRSVPPVVTRALEDALDVAVGAMPAFGGKKVYVLVDVSGSMQSPVTGYRKGATTGTRCVDVAALMAIGVLRRNPGAEVVPFEHRVAKVDLKARDSVAEAAAKLAAVGGGGTDCSAPMAWLNTRGATGDLVVYLSDNESWVDSRPGRRNTETLKEWDRFRKRNPGARLVCVDLQPYASTQAMDRADILNLGGFSETVFERIRAFTQAGHDPDHWVDTIERIEL